MKESETRFAPEECKELKVKKTLILTAIALFAVCFLVAAREGVSKGVCAREDIGECIDHTATCALELDDQNPTYKADLATCHNTLCACLDLKGCDDRLEEANCN
jgi:hypothetical protein